MGRPVGASGVPFQGKGKATNKPMNSDMSQQIIDSAAEDGGMTTGQEDEGDEEDEIPSYGFPSQPARGRGARNRCEATDIDQLISDGGKIGVNSCWPGVLGGDSGGGGGGSWVT